MTRAIAAAILALMLAYAGHSVIASVADAAGRYSTARVAALHP